MVGLLWVACFVPTAHAASPGLEAIERHKEGSGEPNAVENRFFLKQNRFEVSPIFGYVPNNPFARRYMGGATFGFHFNETLSVQSQILYSPDLGEGDLKPLTSVLLERAYQADATNAASFQQPLDKAALTAAFAVAWSPVYGKISLVGETVLNFDLYMLGGIGVVSKVNYAAQYDAEGAQAGGDIIRLDLGNNEVKPAPFVGVGQNYFINRLMSFKIDVRAAFYLDNLPQYDPNEAVAGARLYNNVIASVGFGFFFPNMKPRLYDF